VLATSDILETLMKEAGEGAGRFQNAGSEARFPALFAGHVCRGFVADCGSACKRNTVMLHCNKEGGKPHLSAGRMELPS